MSGVDQPTRGTGSFFVVARGLHGNALAVAVALATVGLFLVPLGIILLPPVVLSLAALVALVSTAVHRTGRHGNKTGLARASAEMLDGTVVALALVPVIGSVINMVSNAALDWAVHPAFWMLYLIPTAAYAGTAAITLHRNRGPRG